MSASEPPERGCSIDDDYGDDFLDYEPDLDFGYEFDSAMDSIGWGVDEDYRPEMDHLSEDW